MLIGERVAAYIARERLLAPGERVVVAVSGGADSLCLLDCLDRLGYPIVVAHLDHRLRRGSWREALFVLSQARRRGLPAVVERADTARLLQRGASLEEAARELRYRFLVDVARQVGANVIATGHTADDQAETVLMHLLRGAGVHGLRGMLPRTSLGSWVGLRAAEGIDLIRPLLATWRAQTEGHCRSAGLRPRRDPSNLDRTFFRNRLRHELLPTLETYNPRTREVLVRTGEVMRREAALLDEIVEAVEGRVLRPAGPAVVALARDEFLAQPAALQGLLVTRAAGRLIPGLRDFGFEAVETALERLRDRAPGRRASLPGGLELLDEGARVVLVARGGAPALDGLPQLPADGPLRLPIPGAIALRSGGRLAASRVSRPPGSFREAPIGGITRRVWLDGDRLSSELIVRPPRPGDRMQPLGMRGRRKLADIFNSLHVPPSARARWPVVVSGDEIVWLAGLRLAHTVRLTSSTRRAVSLVLTGEGSAA